MFDAYNFVRKNAKSLSTPVVAHGFKFKLEGWTDDTVGKLAELAANQVNDVKVSLPKISIDADVERSKSAVLAPIHTGMLIRGEEEPTKKQAAKKPDVKAANVTAQPS